MAFSELVPALQQGTVDGQENPISVIVANNLNQVQRFMTLTRHVYSPQVMICNPAMVRPAERRRPRAVPAGRARSADAPTARA